MMYLIFLDKLKPNGQSFNGRFDDFEVSLREMTSNFTDTIEGLQLASKSIDLRWSIAYLLFFNWR
jgi:hypothetical protein